MGYVDAWSNAPALAYPIEAPSTQSQMTKVIPMKQQTDNKFKR